MVPLDSACPIWGVAQYNYASLLNRLVYAHEGGTSPTNGKFNIILSLNFILSYIYQLIQIIFGHPM